jgi:diguanylate cyclase (GGDEF)-like protein/PAS domain S-box-containing protein
LSGIGEDETSTVAEERIGNASASSCGDPATPRPAELQGLQVEALAEIGNAVVITDSSANIVWVNRAFEQLTGYSSEEVIGKSTRILKSGQTPGETYQNLWRTILRGEHWSGELINRRKDASVYHEEMTIAPLSDSTGTITNFVAVKRDITQRKRLARRTEMLALAVENSLNLIAITDSDGLITYANKALLDGLQWSLNEILGQHFRSLVSHNNSPEVLRQLASPVGWRGEMFSPRKDGTDLAVLLSVSEFVGENGYTGLIGIAQDITEQKRLNDRTRMLANAVENSPNIVGMAGPDGRIVYANRKLLETLQYPIDDVLGRHFSELVSKNNSPELLQEILNGSAQPGGWSGECLVPRKDGTAIPAFLSSSTVFGENGQLLGLLGIAQDISDQKVSQKDLMFKNALLQAQAETTIDGILAVDQTKKVILSNRRFAEIWNVPQKLIDAGDDEPLLRHVLEQIADAGAFLERVEDLYEHPEERSKDEVRLKDGRVLDRYSSPLLDPGNCYLGRIWYFRDITERIRHEERMRLWSQVLDQSAEGIFICDMEEHILVVNRAFEQLTGYSSEEVVGKTPRLLQSGRHDGRFYLEMWRTLLSTGVWRGEIWNRRKSGELYAEWLSISVVYDHEGAPTHYIGIFSDVTARKRDQEKILRLAQFDSLTDLPNRVLLLERLSQTIQAAVHKNTRVAVMFLDIDRFKEVNDSLGHHIGDMLLQTVGRRLETVTRHGQDTVSRMGGDEFVVIFPDVNQARELSKVAQKLLSCVTPPISVDDHELTVTASIGIAIFPEDGSDAHELIRNADAAMYQAKNAGRNNFKFYTSDLHQRATESLSTENALRHAIDRHEFVLYYQPQVNIQTGRLVGMEALIRWRRPDVGLVMPGNFIAIAEERGLIVPIGDWVLEDASRQAAEWRDSKLLSVPIAVNVSALQFRQRDFMEQLTATTEKHGVPPSCLDLELTERTVIRDPESTAEKLRTLHAKGFHLSIDDFGTGYSSLNYLRRFPFDKIKIDRSFIADENGKNIVAAIIGLGRTLNLTVIAEGVETKEQVESLRAQGCDEAQGYLFGPAVPADDFARTVTEWARTCHPEDPFLEPLTYCERAESTSA